MVKSHSAIFYSFRSLSIALYVPVSKVARNCAEFWTFFALQNFRGGPPKLYPYSHPCLAARHVENFREVIHLGPEVITANTLNLS